MKTLVCIKQVPSTTEVFLDPVTHTIIRDGRLSIINPFDLHALEEAVKLKERLGGEVITISMGIPATERLLRDTMARGADRSMLLSDRKFAGADTLATSYALSLGVEKLGGVDLIICGKMAVDGDTAQIGPELAETLGIPHVTDVCEIIEATEESVTCKKVTDEGYSTIKVKLPALITVLRSINTPRMPSIEGIRRSIEASYVCCSADDVQADVERIGLKGSATQVVRTYVPQSTMQTEFLTGSIQQQADALASLIQEVVK